MKSINYFVISIGLLVMTAIACKKNSGDSCKCHDAIIKDRGMIAADGCGWMVEINGKDYHPASLEDAFMVNDLKVKVCYTVAPEYFQCGFVPANEGNGHPVIDISKIEKK